MPGGHAYLGGMHSWGACVPGVGVCVPRGCVARGHACPGGGGMHPTGMHFLLFSKSSLFTKKQFCQI